jgi:hypothetical protein
MAVWDKYLSKAAEFFAKAEAEVNIEKRVGFENLARAYLRQAEQAMRNIEKP